MFLLSTTDPLGRVTRFTYDAAGNVTSITDPAGNVRSFTYELTFNKVTSITDPLGNVTTFEYDATGNLVAITDPEQNRRPVAERLKTRITYNSFGQPLTTTDPLGNTTTFEYDSVGNLTAIVDPLGNRTTRTYDAVSRLITQTDPRGKTSRFAYDTLDRLTQLRDPLGGVTTFTYDPNGNLLTVTDARGSVTTYEYDNMDRPSRRIDPLGRVETFTYDGLGNLVSTTDRKSQVNTFQYDALNRRIQGASADGSTTSLVYDAAGRLVSASDSLGGDILNHYDILGDLIAQTTNLGSIQYTYDALGRRTTMTVNGQPPVSYRYNANSRPTEILSGTLALITFTYDPAGRRTLLRLPNGVTTAYDYDPASRLTRLTYTNPSTLLGDLTYQYDAAGNRVAVGGSFARTLLPDPVGTASYDATNRQLTFGNKQMTYDANGNITTITDPSGTTTFTWDARDRLQAVTGPTATASFTYNPFGRRSEKVINGQLSQQLFDGPHLVHTAGAQTSTAFVHGPSIDEPLLLDASQGYLADGNGNVLALVDSSGTITSTYTYEPFGRSALSGGSPPSPFRFTGREDDGLGLLYYRARYYHPGLHRFLSEDPVGIAGGVNLYTYVGNSPLSHSDPFGLCRDPGGRGLRYCIETYIPQERAWGFDGDNRGPDSSAGDYRTHQEIKQLPDGSLDEDHKLGRTCFLSLICADGKMGPFWYEVIDLKEGGRKITVSGCGGNGLLLFAPCIYYRIRIYEDPSGSARVTSAYGTPFPSSEVWQYGGPSGPQLIYNYNSTAAGTGPSDLYRRVPLPLR